VKTIAEEFVDDAAAEITPDSAFWRLASSDALNAAMNDALTFSSVVVFSAPMSSRVIVYTKGVPRLPVMSIVSVSPSCRVEPLPPIATLTVAPTEPFAATAAVLTTAFAAVLVRLVTAIEFAILPALATEAVKVITSSSERLAVSTPPVASNRSSVDELLKRLTKESIALRFDCVASATRSSAVTV